VLEQYRPGQHLTFKIPLCEQQLCVDQEKSQHAQIKYLIRSYTISNNGENGLYRISVKNEEGGTVSPALHNALKTGDMLEAKGPKGSFVLQQKKRKTKAFMAAGIGITPILSMLKALPDSNEEVFLFLSVKEENMIPFKEELMQVCQDHPNMVVHVFFSQVKDRSIIKENSHWQYHAGRLQMDDIKRLLPGMHKIDFYLCGPQQMTASFTEALKSWKGKRLKVYSESFGAEKTANTHEDVDREIKVHFTRSNTTVEWDHECSNLLEFAESNGVSLEAGCMFGECGACSTKIESGTVNYNYHTAATPDTGNCLPCSCRPVSDITLDV
jgi:ferredoxin-NADP reductase